MGLLAINFAILLHCVCHGLVLSLLLIMLVGLLAGVLAVLAHWPTNSPLGFPDSFTSFFFLTSFYSFRFIAWFIGLPRSIYYIFTSYNFYGLVGPYSCHVNPTKFTTLFFGFPRPVYFFFISHYSYRFTILFLGLPRPTYFIYTSCYFHGPVGYQSCHISPLGLLPYFFTFLPIFFFSSLLLLGFFCCRVFSKKWASTVLYIYGLNPTSISLHYPPILKYI